ncbi:hypothetical protein Btru_042891 [Bulinus truncatus]|nr:hypothetical protein Btru_042891 [Bulinus truncatus]
MKQDYNKLINQRLHISSPTAFCLAIALAVTSFIIAFVLDWDKNIETGEKFNNDDLIQSYIYNFDSALTERMENMKKYQFPYNLMDVDKRSNLSLEEFRDVYDGKWPVIITDVVPKWPAFNWTASHFKENYGDANIVMSMANKSSVVVQMKWFLEHMDASSEDDWLYLQDELFLLQYHQLRSQVLDSVYTRENFFDLFPDEVRPWDCYFLWGTAHSRSSLHVDPYNWTGTNAVISGLKKWKLILPGQDNYLSIFPDRICGFPLECKKYNSPLDLFSKTNEVSLLLDQIQFVEAEQTAGDLLIIPTGWFHQAYNVEPTLALSQQIMNGQNYKVVLEEIFKAGSVPKTCLSEDALMLPPEQLVRLVMSRLSKDVLIRGAEETRRVLESIQTHYMDLPTF